MGIICGKTKFKRRGILTLITLQFIFFFYLFGLGITYSLKIVGNYDMNIYAFTLLGLIFPILITLDCLHLRTRLKALQKY
jgi:hypothetical protein